MTPKPAIEPAYFFYLGVREFSLAITESAYPAPRSTLGNHISHVFALRTKLKMLKTNARRVVAQVHDDHTLWDLALDCGPDPAMGEPILALVAELTIPATSRG